MTISKDFTYADKKYSSVAELARDYQIKPNRIGMEQLRLSKKYSHLTEDEAVTLATTKIIASLYKATLSDDKEKSRKSSNKKRKNVTKQVKIKSNDVASDEPKADLTAVASNVNSATEQPANEHTTETRGYLDGTRDRKRPAIVPVEPIEF